MSKIKIGQIIYKIDEIQMKNLRYYKRTNNKILYKFKILKTNYKNNKKNLNNINKNMKN